MFKLITLSFFCLVASFGIHTYEVEASASSSATTSSATTSNILISTTTLATLTASSTLLIPDRMAVEKRVREYFAATPIMIDIARCESNFRQFTDSGNVFKGGSAGGMIGVFQLFGSIHAAPALKSGFDINTLEGNLGYAQYLYKSSGTAPWSQCVPKEVTPASVSSTDARIQLRIELMTKLIGLLQQLLSLEVAKH